MKQLKIIPIGATVTIWGEIHAKVIGCSIRQNFHISYECAYLHNMERRTVWVEECEIGNESGIRIKVGFC